MEVKNEKKMLRAIVGVGADEKVHVQKLDSFDEESTKSEKSENGVVSCEQLFRMHMSRRANIYSTESVPLNAPWTFWVDRSERGLNIQQFEANLRRIYMVYTVHGFWGVYYNIPTPSSLHHRSSLHMMRENRKPIWEEAYNCKGGTFRMRCPKKDTDKVWRELLMAAIGEQLNEFVSPNDEVCGVSVSVRDREDILLVWNKNAAEASKARVFECVHTLMPDTVFLSEFYKPHITHHAFEKSVKKHVNQSPPPTAFETTGAEEGIVSH